MGRVWARDWSGSESRSGSGSGSRSRSGSGSGSRSRSGSGSGSETESESGSGSGSRSGSRSGSGSESVQFPHNVPNPDATAWFTVGTQIWMAQMHNSVPYRFRYCSHVM